MLGLEATELKQSTIVNWFTFYVSRPEPPFKMLTACLHRIMEYSDPRVCHILATSRKDLDNMLTYELVIKAAMLSVPNYNVPSKLRMEEIMPAISSDKIIIPSPQRLLSLLTGKYCEMGLCCNEPRNVFDPFLRTEGNAVLGVPFTLRHGLFICTKCAECSSTSSKFIQANRYTDILGEGISSCDGSMFWRKPYITASGERIGPALTMADADDIVFGKKTRQRVVVGLDTSNAKHLIEDAFALKRSVPAACSLRVRIEEYTNHVRDKFVDAMIYTAGQRVWIEFAIEQNEDGSFRWHPKHDDDNSPSTEQLCIYMWGDYDEEVMHFFGQWINEVGAHFNNHYEEIEIVGIHDVSFLETGRTPVEQYWYNKWKAALEKDSNFMRKASMDFCVTPDHVDRNPFPDIAEHINYRTILISEALPKERMPISDGPEFEAELRRLWDEENSDPDDPSWLWFNDFDDKCDGVYNGMMSKYGEKDDDDETE